MNREPYRIEQNHIIIINLIIKPIVCVDLDVNVSHSSVV
jgi:hypothetical protein